MGAAHRARKTRPSTADPEAREHQPGIDPRGERSGSAAIAVPGLALPVQRLAVGAVGDPMELEAERVADSVVLALRRRQAEPGVPDVRRDVVDALRRHARRQHPIGAEGGELAEDAAQRLKSASSGGSPVPVSMRGELESALGADLSQVRLHAGSQSSELNRSMSAVAFTHGQDIHFRDGIPDTSTDSGLHLLAHELTHTVQQGAPALSRSTADPAIPPISRFTDTTIRRAPIPTFTGLAPRAGGAPIPVYAGSARPPWLRGGHGEAATVRTEVAATVRSVMLPAPMFGDPAEPGYQCQLCGRWSVLGVMSVDHITHWREFCAPATDHQEFEARYHEVANLQLVHNNCNSSKNAADLFDWWRQQPGATRLQAAASQRIVRALERLFDQHGVDWIAEIPLDKRAAVISGIVQQSSGNAFEHLMGNGKIADAMGGWGGGKGGDGGGDGGDGSSDGDAAMSD
jgi:hypothetical protein